MRKLLKHVGLLVIFTVLSCNVLFAANGTIPEGQIYTSPDGIIDAVVSEIPTSATVSTPYIVSLVPHGKQAGQDDRVLKIDRTAMPTVAWRGNDAASIHCNGARVWDFRNFWQMKSPQGQFRNVAIALACGEKGYPELAE